MLHTITDVASGIMCTGRLEKSGGQLKDVLVSLLLKKIHESSHILMHYLYELLRGNSEVFSK